MPAIDALVLEQIGVGRGQGRLWPTGMTEATMQDGPGSSGRA
jgi:hypothetical protein